MPSTLVELLEAAYLCRCGSVVFPNTGGRTVQCQILKKALTQYYDGSDENGDNYYSYVKNYKDYDNGVNIVTIVLPLCSFKCYKLIGPCLIDVQNFCVTR